MESKRQPKSDKLTQIVQNYFVKAAQLVVQSRSASVSSTKPNKWFNLALDDVPKEELKLWRGRDIFSFQPLIVEVYLDLRALPANQCVVLRSQDTVENVSKKKAEVVLERWLLEFDLTTFDSENVELPLIYKRVIIQFRVLYTYLKLLPAYKLKERLIGQPVKVAARVLDGSKTITSKGRIGLSKKIIKSQEDHLKGKKFDPILTPVGALRCSLSYRKNCDFSLSDNETLLSSHFISMEDQEEQQEHEPLEPSPVDKRTNSLRVQQQRDFSPARRSTRTLSNVQPFKVGSIATSSPPPPSRQALERRSSTSATKPIPVSGNNRSNSSASLALLLRSQRNSFGESTGISLPKSPLGSYPSVPEHVLVSSGSSGAPKFSSSFKLHRGSSRHNSLEGYNRRQKRSGSDSSAFSAVYSDLEPGSGLYVDDDLGDFVKMIDSKPDLRFASLSPQNSNSSDPLNRFQSLRGYHNVFGDNLSASMLQYSNPFRKSSFSSVVDSDSSSFRRQSTDSQAKSEYLSPIKPGPGSASVASTLAYAQMHNEKSSSRDDVVEKVKSLSRRNTGLSASVPTEVRRFELNKQVASTGTSSAAKPGFHYHEHAIVDDDDEEEDDLHSPAKKYGHHDDEDEELLFAMSDMVYANKYANS